MKYEKEAVCCSLIRISLFIFVLEAINEGILSCFTSELLELVDERLRREDRDESR
jgi:hypothetical protein